MDAAGHSRCLQARSPGRIHVVTASYGLAEAQPAWMPAPPGASEFTGVTPHDAVRRSGASGLGGASDAQAPDHTGAIGRRPGCTCVAQRLRTSTTLFEAAPAEVSDVLRRRATQVHPGQRPTAPVMPGARVTKVNRQTDEPLRRRRVQRLNPTKPHAPGGARIRASCASASLGDAVSIFMRPGERA